MNSLCSPMPSFTPACQNHCPMLQHSFPNELFPLPPASPADGSSSLYNCAPSLITARTRISWYARKGFTAPACEKGVEQEANQPLGVTALGGVCASLTSCQTITGETCREQHMSKLVIFLPAFTPQNRLGWTSARPGPSLDSQRSMHTAAAAASSAPKCTDRKVTCECAALV